MTYNPFKMTAERAAMLRGFANDSWAAVDAYARKISRDEQTLGHLGYAAQHDERRATEAEAEMAI